MPPTHTSPQKAYAHLQQMARPEYLQARINRFHKSTLDDSNPVFVVDLNRQFAYAVIGKTGNSSVKSVLAKTMGVRPRVSGYGYPWVPRALANPTARVVRRMLGKSPPGFDPHARNFGWDLLTVPQVAESSFFRFGFVRNPWDRLVSCWSDKVHSLKGKQAMTERFPEVSTDWSFDRFARWAIEQPVPEAHVRPQSKHVVHQDKLILDFVGKFESLAHDWQTVAGRFGFPPLPTKNASQHRPYREHYQGDLANLVGDYYEEDVRRFDYAF